MFTRCPQQDVGFAAPGHVGTGELGSGMSSPVLLVSQYYLSCLVHMDRHSDAMAIQELRFYPSQVMVETVEELSLLDPRIALLPLQSGLQDLSPGLDGLLSQYCDDNREVLASVHHHLLESEEMV